jgi:hypothetical protein
MLRFILPLLALQCFFLSHRPLFSLGQWTKAEITAVDIIVHFVTTNAKAGIIRHTTTNTADIKINAGMGTTIAVTGPARESIVPRVIETVYKTNHSNRPYRFTKVDHSYHPILTPALSFF